MIVSKLITCGLLSLSPITKSTSQIALLENQLSRDSPTYQTCIIDNSNSNDDLLIDNFGTITLEQYNYIELNYSENGLSLESNEFNKLSLGDDGTYDSRYKILSIYIGMSYVNEEPSINFCDDTEEGLWIEYAEIDNGIVIDSKFNDVIPGSEYLVLQAGQKFTYTGPGADILNQVFSNYTQGGNNMANILSAIGTALTTIGQWFVDLFGSMTAIFYDSTTGLTFVGTLLVVGLSCFLIALVINWVRGFVRI